MARFAQDRHKPPGQWVQTTFAESVVGIQYRRAEAAAFAKAAHKAEAAGLVYGVEVRHQSQNPHDQNAIAVFGVAEQKGWFRRRVGKWPIGFLRRELSAELVEDLISRGVPIAAELYSIYEGYDGFLDFKVIVLAPPGHGEKVRRRARQPEPKNPA